MDSQTESKSPIKGGVIIMGSLFWETEKNCISGSEQKGKERKDWREGNLIIAGKSVIKLPVRYGRSSSSRSCTYTMVLSADYCGKAGQGLIVPYLESLDFERVEIFREQVRRLAKVEGIKRSSEWGAVAIWINPKSKAAIRKTWEAIRSADYGHDGLITRFDWEDGRLINESYELTGIDVETDLDFLLCTYIQPKHKHKDKDAQKKYPTPKEIASEILSSGYSTYFAQNKTSGIITEDDKEIEELLREGNQPT